MTLSTILRPLPFAVIGLILLAITAVSVVADNEQVVVLRMGQPERIASHSSATGLIAHIPFLERVVRLDRGLISFSAQDLPLRTTDQQQFSLLVQGKYRIIEPVRLVRTAGDQARGAELLAGLLPGLIQTELGKLDTAHALQPGASGAWQRLAAQLDRRARAYGLQVIDVRAQRIVPAQSQQQATLARMKDEREGHILSLNDAGLQQAMLIRSDAEVEAARIIGASANRDPEFYDFYRAMGSYETMFGDPGKSDRATLILSPESAYLKQMNGRAIGK